MATDSKAAKFNPRNPAVKRILQEIKEIQAETSTEYLAEALEDDIFEWHFVIRGPPDTEFEGGIYHGRILLPPDYPFKPPSFMMLTPNGRFQTGQGALGSLDFSKEERRMLVIKSRTEVPKFGSAERQKIIDDMHQRFLEIESQGRRPLPAVPTSDIVAVAEAGSPPVSRSASTTAEPEPAALAQPSAATPTPPAEPKTAATPPSSPTDAIPACTGSSVPMQTSMTLMQAPRPAQAAMQTASGDWGLTLLAVALAMAIVAIVMRKLLAAMGYRSFSWT